MTLVEVVLALFVVAFVLSSSIAAMMRAYPALDSARNVTIAGQMMQDELERLRLMDWTTLGTVPNGAATIDSSFTAHHAIGTRFQMERTIDSISSKMRRIKLTVSWTGYDGRNLSRSYEARYAKDGIYDFYYSGI